MSFTIEIIAQYLESIAPLSYQASYDNVGLIVGSKQSNIQGILITLDITPSVLQEAKDKGCNLVISHHPPIFQPIQKLSGEDLTTQVITFSIENQIALYAIHTNLDHLPNGVNKILGDKLGLKSLKILQPLSCQAGNSHQSMGAGMIGELPKPLTPKAFLAHLKKELQLVCIRYTATRSAPISHVAICGGSGSFLIEEAKKRQVDAFVTADIKYHQFFQADKSMLLADIGHYESEIWTTDLLYQLLSTKFSKIALYQASTVTNPITYYV